jgi:hypothetical protein
MQNALSLHGKLLEEFGQLLRDNTPLIFVTFAFKNFNLRLQRAV